MRAATLVLAVSAVLAAGACTSSSSHATTPVADTSLGTGGASPGKPLGMRDTAFLAAAAADAQFEIDGGRLASTNAADQRLRQFGGDMVRDHGQEYQRLQALARQTGTPLPSGPASEQHQILTLWSTLHNGAFDCSYAPAVYVGHVGVVAAFTNEAAFGGSAQVRDFASTELPVLREHLRMAGQNLSGLHCTGTR